MGEPYIGRSRRLDLGRRRLLNLNFRLGQRYVGDRPLRRVAWDGGIIADGRQPAGIDAFDGLGGC